MKHLRLEDVSICHWFMKQSTIAVSDADQKSLWLRMQCLCLSLWLFDFSRTQSSMRAQLFIDYSLLYYLFLRNEQHLMLNEFVNDHLRLWYIRLCCAVVTTLQFYRARVLFKTVTAVRIAQHRADVVSLIKNLTHKDNIIEHLKVPQLVLEYEKFYERSKSLYRS